MAKTSLSDSCQLSQPNHLRKQSSSLRHQDVKSRQIKCFLSANLKARTCLKSDCRFSVRRQAEPFTARILTEKKILVCCCRPKLVHGTTGNTKQRKFRKQVAHQKKLRSIYSSLLDNTMTPLDYNSVYCNLRNEINDPIEIFLPVD